MNQFLANSLARHTIGRTRSAVGTMACAGLQLSVAMLLSLAALGDGQAATASRESADNLTAQITHLAVRKREVRQKVGENITHKRDIESRYTKLQSEITDYKTRVGNSSSYCTGTFEEGEYQRRLAWCQNEQNSLNQLGNNLDARKAALDTEDDQRVAEAQALSQEQSELESRAAVLRHRMQVANLTEFEHCAGIADVEDLSRCLGHMYDGSRR